jgi:hypothetical protein
MFKTTFSLAVLCALVCASLRAQSVSTAQINGTVQDSSGLAVPGAAVKATQTATGLVRNATSGADGAYVLPNLPIGPWQLEVTKDGFSKYVQTGVVLQVASAPVVDVQLKIGSVSDQVTVQADAALVETHSTGVGTVVDQQRVVDLPLNGREVTQLIQLAGLATAGNGSQNLNTIRNYPTLLISVAGGQGNGITYLLDGANHNDPFNNLNLPLPFPDALQEFKVETSALPAQYGYHSSAAVNAVTKSGTNEFHGDAFEFFRNGDLNARDFFATTRDTLKRNQYGGTLGGRIIRDKLFFFAGYQGSQTRSTPPQTPAFVPTAAMLTGNFTAFASPACNAGRQITLKAPFVNNTLAPSLFSAPAVNLAGRLPTTTDPCGRVTFGLVTNSSENVGVTRVDYQINSKHSVFGRYEMARYIPSSSYDGSNVLTATNTATFDRAQSVALGETWLISANMVSTFHVTGNRTQVEKSPDQWFSFADLGVQGVYIPVPKFSNVTVSGNGFTFGGAGESQSKFNTESFQVAEDVSWVRGNHQFGFGVNYIHPMQNVITYLNAVGTFTFNGSVTGLGLADFMLGDASSWAQGNAARNYYREKYIGLYAQDSWKVTSRLTVSAGLRWEPFLAPYTIIGFATHFDPAAFAANTHSTVYPNAPAGLTFPGDSGYPGNSSNFNKLSNWAPRLGIVWDPKGDGRMTIRAAFGEFNDFEHLNYNNGFGLGPPFGNSLTFSNVNFVNPWATIPGGNPFPIVPNASVTFPQAGSFASQDLRPHPTYLNQWNLSIQRQVGTNWLLTANYVGNNTIHLWAGNAANPAVYLGTGPCTLNIVNGAGVVVPTPQPVCSTTANQNQRRLLYLQNPLQGQYLGAVTVQDSGGTGTYDGLLLSVQRRLSRGVTILANYTWSHCISDLANSELGIAGPVYIDPNQRRVDRSNCATSDQRQVFNLSTVAQMPRFSNRALRLVASDWQVSAIVSARSSQFFSVTTGVDSALDSLANQRPNLVGNPYPANQTVNNWISASAFAAPAPGTIGNLGANNLLGPDVLQVDMSLTRQFRVREKQTLQFRVEAFNVLNHLNPVAPGGTGSTATSGLNAGNFGQITADISGAIGQTGDPRILQLAAKYVF